MKVKFSFLILIIVLTLACDNIDSANKAKVSKVNKAIVDSASQFELGIPATVIADYDASIYAEPDLSSEIVQNVKQYAVVTVYPKSASGSLSFVKSAEGKIGWMHAVTLKLDVEPSQPRTTPINQKPGEPKPPPLPSPVMTPTSKGNKLLLSGCHARDC